MSRSAHQLRNAGPGGTVTAGTLDLTVGGNTSTVLFDGANIVPGYTKTTTLTLANVGNTPGNLASVLTLTGADGVCTEPEYVAEGKTAAPCNVGGDLQDQMTIAVAVGNAPASTPVTLRQFQSAGFPTSPMGGNSSTEYKLTFALPNVTTSAINNVVQGDSVTLSSSFTLTQS